VEEIRVLLVEDNQGDVVYLTRQLKKAVESHFLVHATGWLNSALQALEMGDYDVILLDLSLPDCQGVDTVVEILKSGRGATIPVVVMTGHDDMESAVRCVRYGAQDYLIKKKVEPRTIELTIRTAIERKRTDLISKQLMHAALAGFDSDGKDAATVRMMRDFVHGSFRAIQDIKLYVAKNAKAHIDAIQNLLDKHNMTVLSRELNTVLSLDPSISDTPPSGTRRPRAISEQAMKAVDSIVGKSSDSGGYSRPSDPPQAKAALLDVITRNSEKAAHGE